MFQALEQRGECEEKDFWFRQFAELEKESPALCYFAIMYGWVNRCNRCPVRKAFTNCRIDINSFWSWQLAGQPLQNYYRNC